MRALEKYDWLDLPRISVLAALYFLLSIASATFAMPMGASPLITLQAGMALAALLILGMKCWPGILIGAFAASTLQGTAFWPALLAAPIITLGYVSGAWLLPRFRFLATMERTRDFLLLFLFPGMVGTGASAVAITLAQQLPLADAASRWLGDILGIALITPLILIWPKRSEKLALRQLVSWRTLEFVVLFTCTLALGQIIFLDWLREALGTYPKAYLMFVFIIWAAIRFGHYGVLLILAACMVQGLYSVNLGIGLFSQLIAQENQINFSVYFLEMGLIGLLLAATIKERNAAVGNLKESEARFSSFMHHMPGVALIKDAQQNLLYQNDSASAQRITSILPGSLADTEIEQLKNDDEIVLSQCQTVTSEVTLEETGEQHALLSIKFPVRGASNTPLIGGLMLDITARKRAEARVRQLTQLYQTLSHINQRIVRLESEKALFPLVCQTVVMDGGMKMAWVGIQNKSTGVTEPVTSHGDSTGYLTEMLAHGCADPHSPPALALHRNRHVIINQFSYGQSSARWERAIRHGFRSTASFPIMQKGDPYAVLSVFSDQPNAFDTEAISLLDELTTDIGFALENFERERQRRQAQHDLENSERRFRAFFERSMVGMATYCPQRGWIDANDALCQILGHTREKLMRSNWFDMTHPDETESNLALYRQILRGEISEFAVEKRFVRPDGSIIHVHIAARVLRHEDGGIDYVAILAQDITESKKTAELVWKQANFDSLTGLINRSLFHDRLRQEIKKAERTQRPLGLVFIDLDQFKEINDRFGHASGDTLLIQAAQRIAAGVRASDTLARLGGDEFVVILAECHERAAAGQVAKAIIDRLSQPFDVADRTVHVTASIGIAFYPDDATDANILLGHADQAMYDAKNQGRNRFSYFARSMQDAAQQRMSLANDLRIALSTGQLQLYFQPIIELSSNRIFKAEALVRWRHPQRGLINPQHFIPLAEETGMMPVIGEWVFREAAYWARRWSNLSHGGVQISVNKSPAQFLGQNHDQGTWLNHLHDLGLPAKHMAVEINENLLNNDNPAILKRLLRLQDAGIQVTIDDFGKGGSSLQTLNKFNFDYLKIAPTLALGRTVDSSARSLPEAIIAMAHKLGIKVIAEGVETEEQRTQLATAGCDFAQGFLFSRPVPAKEFEKLLQA